VIGLRELSLLKTLNEHNIPFLLVKPTIEGRDVDIALKPEHIWKCVSLSGGYVTKLQTDRISFKREHEEIEVHPSLSWFGMEMLNSAEVWSRSKEVMLEGLRCNIPSPEDQLLILCVHSIIHLRLKLKEIEETKKIFENVNFSKVRRLAEAYGLLPMLKLYMDTLKEAHQTLYGSYSFNHPARVGVHFKVTSSMTKISERCQRVHEHPPNYPFLMLAHAFFVKIIFNLSNRWRTSLFGIFKIVGRLIKSFGREIKDAYTYR